MARSAAKSKIEIHPSAVIHPKAKLEPGVVVGPYSVIGENVQVGRNTEVGAHVVIDGWTRLGKNNRIFTGAVIGTEPQDLKYVAGTQSFVKIGDFNTIREYATINRGTDEGDVTEIGNHNLIMAYAHVAHNCVIQDHVIMANVASLAGHIVIESHAILGGLAAVHQFVRIGTYAIVGGASAVRGDVLPYCTYAGNPAKPYGLNLEGLRRHKFPVKTVRHLKKAYRVLFRSNLSLDEAKKQLKKDFPGVEEIDNILNFLRQSKRHIPR